jgi:hypothetical protein
LAWRLGIGFGADLAMTSTDRIDLSKIELEIDRSVQALDTVGGSDVQRLKDLATRLWLAADQTLTKRREAEKA